MRRMHVLSGCLIITSCVMGSCTLKDMDDTINHCGESQKDCTILDPYWADGECINGDCIAKDCILGAHLPDQSARCERDTVEACGKEMKNCYQRKQICSKGDCADDCTADETNCEGACRNLSSDTANCGECGYACPEDANATISCMNGKCVLVCHNGYTYSEVTSNCQKTETSTDNPQPTEPECISNGTCTCDERSQTECIPVCTEGYQGEGCSECAQGYQKEDTGKCERISEPVDKGCVEQKMQHGKCICEDSSQPCIIQCNPGYTGENCDKCDIDNGYISNNSGECIQATKPDVPSNYKSCIKNEDCYLTNGIGTCEETPSKKFCSVKCDDTFAFDAKNFRCYLEGSNCSSETDCTVLKKWMTPVCYTKDSSNVCSYDCNSTKTLKDDGTCQVKLIDCDCPIDPNGIFDCNKDNKVCEYTCNEGYHPKSDHTGCEADEPAEPCTAEKCKAQTGWKEAKCENNQCIATECDTGYHLYTEAPKNSTAICEKDSTERCGEPYVDCETTVPGWEIGNCVDGSCSVTHCKPDYYFNDNECVSKCAGKYSYYCSSKSKCCQSEADCSSSIASCKPVLEPDLQISCAVGQTDCDGDGKYCCDNASDCDSMITKQNKCSNLLSFPSD